ncbi:MAG: Glu-tRNA(Gln) amidotransferase subunit GatD [Nanoarchaeota archaeon]|nr:Glu-tRNA(Gln) amidotransferase subunit GatD [Nanoarchaeota archaeon]
MAEEKPEVGDIVKLTTIKGEVEGRLLESPKTELYLIKLKSGYNIGIKKENVHKIEVVEKFKTEREEYNYEKNPALPNVDIIITGGTISSSLDAKTGAVSNLTKPEQLLKYYPGLFKIANVRKIEVPFMVSSEDMNSEHWIKIAKVVEKSLNDSEVSGVIVTHGTDFLHYTSAALSFFLKDLNKPVVLTYSQRSTDRASSDAALNLECAARMAVSNVAEVMLVGHGSQNDDFCFAHKGTKVRKLHSSRRDAFKSVNASPIAKINSDGKIEYLDEFVRRNEGKVSLDVVFNDKVALVKYYPGMDPEILDYYASRYEGIVLEVGGLGHVAVSGKKSWIAKLKKVIDSGLKVAVCAQTIFGSLNPNVYSNGRTFEKTGAVFCKDMLAETALIKSGWILGHKKWKYEFKDKMLINYAGEISDRIEK